MWKFSWNLKNETILVGTDGGKEVVNKTFNDFLQSKKIKRIYYCSPTGAVFAENFDTTSGNLLKELFSEKCIADWIDVKHSVTNKYKKSKLLLWI